MTTPLLGALAEAAGIALHWQDYRGQQHAVAPEVLQAMLTALGLPCASAPQIAQSHSQLAAEQSGSRWPTLITAVAGAAIALPAVAAALQSLEVQLESGECRWLAVTSGARPTLAAIAEPGYHQLLVGPAAQPVTLAVAPPKALSVSALAPERRPFGIGVQLYSLRNGGDCGIGDFGGLRAFATSAGRQGVDALALSPVHALFAADPDRYAPYSPSSRLFLNPMHADAQGVLGVRAFADARAATGLAEHCAALEALPLIDYGQSARAKYALLAELWRAFAPRLQEANSSDALAMQFRAYCAEGGARLHDHAVFEALHARQMAAGEPDWRRWQPEWRNARSAEVAQFAEAESNAVDFHRFLQWLTAASRAKAQQEARAAGMRIGLINDLAVGTDAIGSHAWSRPEELLRGLNIGAPPDPLAPEGQDWGLTTFSPRSLTASGFAPFIDLLRANLRDAGGLRIDHVLGLRRLWLAPNGAAAGQGAYLQYPLEDLLRLTALESHRHRAIIIGEDLGTVPACFQQTLADHGVLGLRVLYFERAHKLFTAPQRWSNAAVATTSTHDLPPVAGWWQGTDIAVRTELGFIAAGEAAAKAASAEREESRRCLLSALAHEGLMADGPTAAAKTSEVVEAACQFVASTPAPLVLLPLEDVLGLAEMPNLPGTVEGHPNWRRRLAGNAAALLDDEAVVVRLRAMEIAPT